MRVFIGSLKQGKRLTSTVIAVAVAVLLFRFPQAAASGVSRGLAVCTDQLIPSLFPFLVLSGFLIKSGTAAALGNVAAPLMRPLGFSGVAATALTLSVLGGYPSGANAVAGLLEQQLIDRDEGEKLMRACVHAGPAFVLGGVGVGMLGSWQAGALLLAAHWLSGWLVLLFSRSKTAGPKPPPQRTTYPPLAAAVTASVHDAARSLVGMCGFVLLASCALSLVDALAATSSPHTVWRCAFACFMEVTTGCVEAAAMGAAAPFWLGVALGFGGLSVHGQIAARTAPHRLMTPAFFAARLWHALLGGWLTQLLFWWLSPPMPAVPSSAALSSLSQTPVVGASALAAMMLMCVLLLYTVPLQKRDEW